jgi:hypothetical protein
MAEDANSPGSGGGGFDWSFLGAVATAIPGLVSQFDRKGQNTQLEIEQARAQAAQANADAAQKTSTNAPNITLYVVVGVVLIVLAFLFLKKPNHG